MNLVAYSDSEGSDSEAPSAPREPSKPAAATSKPAFQKVVDRSNSHKIRVNLATAAAASTAKDDIDGDAPPAKKARTGGGAFSGFNALLPAPKRTGQAASGGAKKGLGVGVSLKTGATPAFSREPVSNDIPDAVDAEGGAAEEESSADKPKENAVQDTFKAPDEPNEVKLVGKPTVFKPLSVARNTKKKKKPAQAIANPTPLPESVARGAPAVQEKAAAAPKPKVSLFSISQTESEPAPAATSGAYTPMLYQDDQEAPDSEPYTTTDIPETDETLAPPTTFASAPPGPQTLDTIAADLNLTEAQRRQLFGRQRGKGAGGPDLSAINVVNFNTDEEYKANEALRATGQTIEHNPVRAIAPGKHSLKQLVNAAQTQKDALEEHFAAGRRNKREAGGKYGW